MKTKNHLITNARIIEIIDDDTGTLTFISLQPIGKPNLVTAWICGEAATQHHLSVGECASVEISLVSPLPDYLLRYQILAPEEIDAPPFTVGEGLASIYYINYTKDRSFVACFACFKHPSRTPPP